MQQRTDGICRLRSAGPLDLPIVASWVTSEAVCWLWSGPEMRYPIDLRTFAIDLGMDRHRSYVLMDDRLVHGFGQIVTKWHGRGHLARLIVDPAVRGRGHGMRLADALLHQARTIGHAPVSLNVDPSNRVALAIYRRLGFKSAPRPIDEPVSDALYMEAVP